MATLLDVKCVYFSSEHLWADFFYSKPETRILKTNSTANDAPATFLFFFFVQKLNS